MLEAGLTQLKASLTESWVRIDFTKIDGSNRSMLCTRNFVDIPDGHRPKGFNQKVNETVLNVFDLEKQAWRSIRIDSINGWEIDRSI